MENEDGTIAITSKVTGGTARAEILRAIFKQCTGHVFTVRTPDVATNNARQVVWLARQVNPAAHGQVRIVVWLGDVPVWHGTVKPDGSWYSTDFGVDASPGSWHEIMSEAHRLKNT